MTREIKFRAWCENQKYMAYQGTADLETIQSFMFHFGDKILMQYTGLKDKNGKEIHEGDILKAKKGDLYIIDFQFGSFGAYWSKDDDIWYSCATISFDKLELKVIGNIYENQDLLRE